MMITEKNCIGYAFHHWELDEEERFRDPLTLRETVELFRKASPEDADAVGVIGNFFTRRALVHLAVIDEKNRDVVTHRPHRGARPESVSVSGIRADGSHSTVISEIAPDGTHYFISGPPEVKVFLKLRV